MHTNVYYHNPRCSKSREGLSLLTTQGVKFNVKEYLKEPLDRGELEALFEKLGKSPEHFVRKKESLYKELGLEVRSLSPEEWIEILMEHPKLLERPILVYGGKAAVGRPPSNLLDIL